ncbi:Bug family tripartite tricarboxylate transporter substrate binding protein [Roseomonas sp. BN140053]|uniref:Bug family tripartite tricarboxylate transporter substrate binding protein n=1 Tax=Roseomonas sp. BN140053 TaxID=3391898 RepID=UPI0039E785B2
MITRRHLVAGAVALGLLGIAPLRAQDNYPTHAIQIVNPYPAGNSTDLLTRALAAGLSPRLGQPVVVVNRDGASGAVGSASVARAPADGYTLLFAPALVSSVLPITQPNSGLRANSMRPVCQMFSNAQAIAVRPDSRFRNLAELVAAARAEPGRITYGTLGVASIPHLAIVQWADLARVELAHVPYRADSTVLTEVTTGRIELGAIVLASAAGREDVRLLAVFDTQRHPDFPDVPTAIEQGFDVAPTSFGGLFAPVGVPEARLAKLESACAAVATDAGYRTAARNGTQPANYHLGAAEFARRIAADVEQKTALLRRVQVD